MLIDLVLVVAVFAVMCVLLYALTPRGLERFDSAQLSGIEQLYRRNRERK